MFPGAPTCLRGGLTIGAVDEDTQARVVTKDGRPWGAWVDDTTENAQHDLAYYVGLTVAKYEPVGQHILVCVPPGQPHHHWPAPVISVYEAYIYGMGVPPGEWLPLPTFPAYIVQWRWPGTNGTRPPSVAQRLRLLNMVRAKHPNLIFTF